MLVAIGKYGYNNKQKKTKATEDDILVSAGDVCIHYGNNLKCMIPDEVKKLYENSVKCPCYNPHPGTHGHDNEKYKGKINSECLERHYYTDDATGMKLFQGYERK